MEVNTDYLIPKHTLVFLKMAVFWVVAPCSLVEVTDVSEMLAASIIREMTHVLRLSQIGAQQIGFLSSFQLFYLKTEAESSF
jgi:hypothetical protein